MDLLSTLPSFPTKPYAHILPSLERNNISTADLITLDTLEIAKRAHVPPADVRRLAAQIVDALHRDVGFQTERNGDGEVGAEDSFDEKLVPGPLNRVVLSRWNSISTLDPAMDALLDGGIPTGYVTEVTGEGGSGKTQFLLSLLLAVQLPTPQGLSKQAIYISTEAPLATPRLSQYLASHPSLSSLPDDQTPSLHNVLSINAMDLETQEHILNYQLPVAIARYNVGLVVVDSITANFRAEHSSHDVNALSTRSGELAKLGLLLRNLAAQNDIAVVVANQVSDRLESIDSGGVLLPPPSAAALPPGTGNISSSPALSPALSQQADDDGSYLIGTRSELSLLHQQRFFTGWGDSPNHGTGSALKTPALGFVWTTQIACRIALKRDVVALPSLSTLAPINPAALPSQSTPVPASTPADPDPAPGPTHKPPGTSPPPPPPEETQDTIKRTMKLVFAPWTGPADNEEVEFAITRGGLRSIHSLSRESP